MGCRRNQFFFIFRFSSFGWLKNHWCERAFKGELWDAARCDRKAARVLTRESPRSGPRPDASPIPPPFICLVSVLRIPPFGIFYVK